MRPWYDRRSSCVTQRPKWDAMRPSSSRVGVLTGIALSSFLHTAHTVVPRPASLARALRLCIRGLRLRGDPVVREVTDRRCSLLRRVKAGTGVPGTGLALGTDMVAQRVVGGCETLVSGARRRAAGATL